VDRRERKKYVILKVFILWNPCESSGDPKFLSSISIPELSYPWIPMLSLQLSLAPKKGNVAREKL